MIPPCMHAKRQTLITRSRGSGIHSDKCHTNVKKSATLNIDQPHLLKIRKIDSRVCACTFVPYGDNYFNFAGAILAYVNTK